jgi:hypothetical protein
MNDDRKPLWPWIASLLIGLPLLYVASFGPASWIASRTDDFGETPEILLTLYRPVEQVWRKGPEPVAIVINRYCYAFAAPGWQWHGGGPFPLRFVSLKIQPASEW